MKRFLWILAILVLAVLAGVGLIELPGYVLIQVNLSSVEMPLWLAALLVLGSFLILLVLYRAVAIVMKVPRYLKKMKQRRQMQRLQSALESFINKDWLQAEQHFKKLAKAHFLQPYSQLMAANSAAKASRLEAQEQYIKAAKPVLAHETALIELTKLDLLASAQNWQELLHQIQKIKQRFPSNAGLLRREIVALEHLKYWPQIVELLPECKQHPVLSEAEYDRLAIKAYQGTLRKAVRYSPQTVDMIWETIPSNYQLEAPVAAAYAEHLLKAQQFDKAEKLLDKAIEQHPDAQLFLLYSQIEQADHSHRLSQAEVWLRQNPVSAESLSIMAQICLSNKQLSKAKSYAEQSLSIKPNAAAYCILAQIFEQEGEPQKALKTYRQAAALLS
ncbi:MAG: hemY [Gammaproteobacteria bacterium]|jgi:HemY protein|nr:hemY [Gammaproteobacteria bacterium]